TEPVMRWMLLVAVLFASPAAGLSQKKPAPEPPAKFAITGVTVIDVAAGRSLPDMTVLVVGDRITEVGKADAVAVPKDAAVVAGKGKFLVPGLWDMHAHVE